MKYVRRDMGEAADASSGGGNRGLRREVLVLVGLTLVLAASFFWGVGFAVELILPRISLEREQIWFRNIQLPLAQVAVERDHNDALLRVESVLHELQQDGSVPAIDFRVLILAEDEPNAFAFPGGTIGVTRGLLDLLPDEIPLAFVLGHEIGHIVQRDPLRSLGRRFGRALLWALVFGDGGGDVVSEHVTSLLELRHSRQAEAGADRFGLRLVHAIYGTTEGTDELFKWLEAREDISVWVAMLSTHPDPGERLADLRSYAKELDPEAGSQDAVGAGETGGRLRPRDAAVAE